MLFLFIVVVVLFALATWTAVLGWRKVGDVEKQLGRVHEFLGVYKAPQEVVNAELCRVAEYVKKAVDEELEFLKKGHFYQELVEGDIIEDYLERRADSLATTRNGLHSAVKIALSCFWERADLATEFLYEVEPSWKPYAGLPYTEEERERDSRKQARRRREAEKAA